MQDSSIKSKNTKNTSKNINNKSNNSSKNNTKNSKKSTKNNNTYNKKSGAKKPNNSNNKKNYNKKTNNNSPSKKTSTTPKKNENVTKVEPKEISEVIKEEPKNTPKEIIIEETIAEPKIVEKDLIEKKQEAKKEEKQPKKFSSIFYCLFLVIYLEIVIKLIAFKSLNGLGFTLIFSLPFIAMLYLILNIFKEKGNKIMCFILTILLSVYYGFQCVFFHLFSNIFSFNTIALASDIGEFNNMFLTIIGGNILTIILYLIPVILLIIFRKKLSFKRTKSKNIALSFILCVVIYILGLLCLSINKNDVYSAYNLYYNINSEIKNVETFGVATTTRLDIKRIIFGFEEQLITEELPKPNEPEIPDVPAEPKYNKIEINFTDLINNENNSTIKNVLKYFENSEPTNQNEYTGMFKGKNLIFILAEGFNMIAVDKELTPTLYKLTHEGFVFNNFYSPVFLSTTGGEFQATTGLIPTQETLNNWKKYQPTIKYALGNSFSNIGYKTESYHDWTYTYYKRQNTMPTLGFNDYMGCGNGLEKLMSCAWLPSDVDMINKTFPLYKDNEHFATYYVSVSGHAPYVYNSSGNSIALKNIKAVENLPYTEHVKSYLATQIEFDKALESLINSLEKEGLLDDTVISFVGDHYPYTLTLDEVNELSTYERDEIVEANRSNFVIWNNKMEKPLTIDKVGSQIDVLPTLLNLFGIEYDSRLIIGKDILSDIPGLAIFSDRSWVSDYGTYKNGKFTLKENKSLPNETEYISSINNIVANRFTISNQIIKYNMYDYIFK